MLEKTSPTEQYKQGRHDAIRVLVVGAGIAGVTAAQLLRSSGLHPVVVERCGSTAGEGYMLALMPMVDRALGQLGVREAYRENSTPFGRYRLHGHKGKTIRTDSMGSLLSEFGDYRGIGRGELLETLSLAGCPVAFGTTVTSLADSDAGASVVLETPDGPLELEFDAVVIADGLHSTTRGLVSGAGRVEMVDTKWGGWVVWAPGDADMDMGEELWGAGFFLGIYPVKGRVGVFLGCPREDAGAGPASFVQAVRHSVGPLDPRLDRALLAVSASTDPYYWPLEDCRAPSWASGRTVLLGDAGAGFLPTAGIGAGMAMESAWVLTGLLGAALPETVPGVLAAFETAQRPRVEAAQDNSRALARLMFRRSAALALGRDVAMRFTSLKLALRPIRKLLAAAPGTVNTIRE